MASGDISSLLGNLGGALGAQATGGQPAVAQFLQGVQANQLKQAEREFKRETALRDQLFQQARDRRKHQDDLDLIKAGDHTEADRTFTRQMERKREIFAAEQGAARDTAAMARLKEGDKTEANQTFQARQQSRANNFQLKRDKEQREHDRQMLKAREDQTQSRVNEQAANALALAASQDPALGKQIADSVATSVPALADVAQGLDWSDPALGPQVARAFVESVGADAAKGFTEAKAQQGKERGARYEALTGAPAPSGYSDADALAFERAYSAAQGDLNTASLAADTLNTQLESTSRLPPGERLGQLEQLGTQLQRAQSKLPVLQGSVFMGNPSFGANAASTMSSFGILEGSLDRERRSTAKEIAAGHDFTTGVGSWQGLAPNYGGQPGEEQLFQEALSSSAPALQQMDQTLSVLQNTDPEILTDLGYLKDPTLNALRKRMVGGDPGDPLTSERLLKEYRSAQIEGNTQRMSEIDTQIKALAGKKPDALQADIGRRVDWVGQVVATDAALASMKTGVLDTLGFGLDPAAALDRYGVPGKDPSGAKVWDNVVSPRQMFADPAIQDSLASKLWVGIPDDVEFDAVTLSLGRLDALAKQLPQSFGTEAKEAVRQRILSRSAQSVALGPLAAPQEITGYSDVVPKRYQAMSSGVSDRSLLPVKDQLATREKVQRSVSRSASSLSRIAQRDVLDNALSIVRSAQRPSKQHDVSFFTALGQTLTGGSNVVVEDNPPDARFAAEAEGDASHVTLRDMHELFRKFAPGYEQKWRGYGSPARQAFPYRTHQVGLYYSGPTEASHAGREEEYSYLNGSNSIVKALENSADTQVVPNYPLAGWLDLMRGISLSDAADSATPEEYALLQGIQTNLRTMSPREALQSFLSPNSTGVSPEMLGLDPASMDAYEAGKTSGSAAFNAGRPKMADLHTELEAIDRAASELDRLQGDLNSGRIVDTVPGPGAEYALLDEQLLQAETQHLVTDRQVIQQRIDGLTELQSKGDATKTLAVALGGGMFPKSAGELAESLGKNALLSSGTSQDVMSSLSQDSFSVLAERLAAQENGDPVFLFRQLSDVVQMSASKTAASLGNASAIPVALRTATAQEQGRSFAHSLELVNDFSDMLNRNPNFRAADASSDIAPYLVRGGFDDMPSGTKQERQWKALALWSAGAQAYTR